MAKFRLRKLSSTAVDKMAAAVNSSRVRALDGKVVQKNLSQTYALTPYQQSICVFIVVWSLDRYYVRPVLKTDWNKVLGKANLLEKAIRGAFSNDEI